MENMTIETLEQVLPPDPAAQNDVLKRLVLTLRSKLNASLLELQTAKDQLCQQCNVQRYIGSDDLVKKDLAAAVAKVASIKADYDSLVGHFQQVKEKHQSVLVAMEQQRLECERLRQRNVDLVKQVQTQQVDLSKFNELQVLLTNCQFEKDKLAELQARSYAASLDQGQKLQMLQQQSQQQIISLQNQNASLEQKQQQFNALQQENARLRAELSNLFHVTSSTSITDLSQQLQQLQSKNRQYESELEILSQKIQQERVTSASKLELEKRKILEAERMSREQQLQNQKSQFDQQSNLQIQQFQNQINELTRNLNESKLQIRSQLLETEQTVKNAEILNQTLKNEKLVFENAKERAKKRNQILNDQLNETLQTKDELEARVQQQTQIIMEKEREINELKIINQQFQKQTESVFLQLKDIPQQYEQQIEMHHSTIKLSQSQADQIEQNLKQIEIEDEIQVQDQKTLNIQVTCKGGENGNKHFVVLQILGEQIHSQQFTNTEGDTIIQEAVQIPWTDAVRDQFVEEGIPVYVFSPQNEQEDVSGVNAQDLVVRGSFEAEMEVGGVILEIRAAIVE
ncbi:Conserved_hypothetical protein [Hexamita inflata]|uniref:Uncharacterized protein n=1 Tax=Hexamita inflata TaxID=28002 RepID=A0ABP1KRE1_9EUKA